MAGWVAETMWFRALVDWTSPIWSRSYRAVLGGDAEALRALAGSHCMTDDHGQVSLTWSPYFAGC